jgi:uncharacterized OB-fold protein
MSDKITTYKCKKCGRVMYPWHDRCLKCKGREFDEIEMLLPATGKLLTYSQLFALPWRYDVRFLTLGVVEFQNGVRAMGQLKTPDVKVGMKVKATWEPVRVIQGRKVYGLKFEPA